MPEDVMGGSWSLEHRPSCASAAIAGAYGWRVALKRVWLSPSRPQVPYFTPVLCHCSGWQSAPGFYRELLRSTVGVRAGVVEQDTGGLQYSLFSTVYYLSWPLGCFWMKWTLFCGRTEMWISIRVYDRDEQITRRICFWLWLAWVLSGSWEVQDHISQNRLPYSPLMSEYF